MTDDGAPRRVRFRGLEVERCPGGRCRASVALEHPDGRTVRETAEETAAGDVTELRCSALATLKGLGYARSNPTPYFSAEARFR